MATSETGLRKAAEEFNSVMGLKPAIDIEAPLSELIPQLKEAIGWIDPEDVFSRTTRMVIDELSAEVEADKASDQPQATEPEEVEEETVEPEAKETEEEAEPTPAYVNQDREEERKKVLFFEPTTKSNKSGVAYYQKSSVIPNLSVGSKVRFTTAGNSRVAPNKDLIGVVKKIKTDPKKTPHEVLQIETAEGMFYKTTKSVTLR
jgi:hypothetical protein